VGAVVQARQLPPHRLVVALQLDAGIAHGFQGCIVHLHAADEVEHQVHLDAGARALGQRLGEFLADRFRPVDIGLEGDGFLRARIPSAWPGRSGRR
jgi:hypothetical protein